jgi:hypothetical protein
MIGRLNRPISVQSQVVRSLRASVRILVIRLERRSKQEREEPFGIGRRNISYNLGLMMLGMSAQEGAKGGAEAVRRIREARQSGSKLDLSFLELTANSTHPCWPWFSFRRFARSAVEIRRTPGRALRALRRITRGFFAV